MTYLILLILATKINAGSFVYLLCILGLSYKIARFMGKLITGAGNNG